MVFTSSNRQWGDLVSGFYKARWAKFIDFVRDEADGKKPQPIDWFKFEWDWVISDTKCTKKLREDSLKALCKQIIQIQGGSFEPPCCFGCISLYLRINV